MSHRRAIVLAVALATYAVGRVGPPMTVIALFGAAVAVTLYAHLLGRGDDRFAGVYAMLMGAGAALVAGVLALLG